MYLPVFFGFLIGVISGGYELDFSASNIRTIAENNRDQAYLDSNTLIDALIFSYLLGFARGGEREYSILTTLAGFTLGCAFGKNFIVEGTGLKIARDLRTLRS